MFPSHPSAESSRWASSAASSASEAVTKTAQKASPTVLKTWPPCPSMLLRRIESWRSRAACIAAASRSHSLVEPSMSVKRNVTVPAGRSVISSSFAPEAPGHSEREGVQVTGCLHGPSEDLPGFGHQLPGVGESVRPDVGEDETAHPGLAGDRTGVGRRGVAPEVRRLGLAAGTVGLAD